MAVNIYFDDIKIGDQIPVWSRKTDFMNWNRYAAVNDEFIYIHMDDEAGRAAANEQGAFGMGNLRFAYILNALRDWLGDETEIRELRCEFRAINQKNDVLTVTGTVKDKRVEEGENRVYIDVDVVNQTGAKTCPGKAIVVLPGRTSQS
jgi:acyl dehydratase